MAEISISVCNRLYKTIVSSGEHTWSNGSTTVEFNSSKDASKVHVSIQRKGFGSKSSKSAGVQLDIETTRELAAFLSEHISMYEKVVKMRIAGDLGSEE